MYLVKLHSSEEIAKKNLNNFILTNLKKKNIVITTKDRLYVSFIKELKLYQIFIFQDKIPEIFFYKPLNETELLVSKKFFLLFKNYRVYFYEKCEKLDLEDIYTYLEKSFFLTDIRISYFDDIILDKKLTYNFLQPIKPKLFKLFSIYILILPLIFYFYDNQIKNEDFSDYTKDLENKKIELEYVYLEEELLKIKTLAKSFDVKPIHIEYRNSSYFLILHSSSHKALEGFLKSFNFYKLEKIENDNTQDRLLSHVYIKFDRR